MSGKIAVVLLSGGIDSATILAISLKEGFSCDCLSFEYGQRHTAEVDFTKQVAAQLGASEHRVAKIDILSAHHRR